MTDHAVGGIKGTRLGCLPVMQVFPVSYLDTTAVAKKLCTIPGTTQEPLAFRIQSAVLMTAFNGTTSETLSVGIVGAGYTDMINAQNVWTGVAAGTNLTLASNPVKIVTADTDLYSLITQGGTTPTAGLVYVAVEIWGVNTSEPVSIGG